jgi:hypothetical protein
MSPRTERINGFYRSPERFTGLQPGRSRAKTAVPDSAPMTTLQHTPHHPVIRNRIALVALLTGAVAALIVALAIANSNGTSSVSNPQPSPAQLHQQLESVNGARYGLARPSASPKETPAQQLQAVAGARYHQPAWVHRAN